MLIHMDSCTRVMSTSHNSESTRILSGFDEPGCLLASRASRIFIQWLHSQKYIYYAAQLSNSAPIILRNYTRKNSMHFLGAAPGTASGGARI